MRILIGLEMTELPFYICELDVVYVGSELTRPECVIADKDGSLWVSDGRGGITHVIDKGHQEFIPQTLDGEIIEGSMPNGLALCANGNLAVANMGTRRLEVMSKSGEVEVLCDAIEGQALGILNFVLEDKSGQLWFTVSSRNPEFMESFRPDIAAGYIGLYANGSAKIVADNLKFPNEIRFDADEEYLYVAETTGKRVRRMKVVGDQLGKPEVFGPNSLGDGFPDGIAFDAEGNIWVAMVVAEKIIVIAPDQQTYTILDAGNATAISDIEKCFSDCTLTREQLATAKGTIAPLTSSIAFGGKDLRTVYLGCLAGNRIASFRSPVAGQPMAHWI